MTTEPVAPTATAAHVVSPRTLWHVITSSSAGTLIEWYDFYIFGSLASIIAEQFFPATNPVAGYLSTLATFAAGFVVRPFGAIVFGRIGDLIGRKYTFLLTLMLMGGSTFAIGLVPGYATLGIAAPILVLLLRLLQGLALGGEYGGAATYVAEHAPDDRRGFYTSFIQTTATLGLFVSLGVILTTRLSMEPAAFSAWGWRIPFLLSILLVGISYLIRARLRESPLFVKLKAEGKTSRNPLKESFANWENGRMVLLALFGATAGQGVVWYTGQFYALSFIQKTMSVEFVQSNYLIATALLLGTPFFIVFGHLSDRIGRKRIMMAGCLLAVLGYLPLYHAMYDLADRTGKTPVGLPAVETTEARHPDTGSRTVTTHTLTRYADGTTYRETQTQTFTSDTAARTETKQELTLGPNAFWRLVLLVTLQVLLVTMVYGPIAAFLVELFPTRIRYTSMSLPYHIGNGVFGGLTPFIATAVVSNTGNPFAGLWYPIGVALLTLVVGTLFIRETNRHRIWA
jgi:MHS family proline/betaine transporter-like MFS transporter